MARKKSSGPIPIVATEHRQTRANIPTADAEVFIDPASIQPKQVIYERDPSLDPQLVWRGKDKQDSSDLLADAPPIYIQEKIDPQVLIENLRRTAERPEDEPELTLFDDFDGLDELSADRVLSAFGQLGQPNDSWRLAERYGIACRTRIVAGQSTDDLHRPAVRD